MVPLVAALLFTLCLAPHAHAESLLPHADGISIRVHDYAKLDQRQLARAQRMVSEAYGRVGVVLDWRQTAYPLTSKPGGPTDGPSTITIVVLAASMSQRLDVPSGVAGFAATDPGQVGRVAFVLGGRVAEIARKGRSTAGEVLAGIIAHELAHLLMPDRAHSSKGVMRARWHAAEFRHLERQRFSDEEAAALRQTAVLLSRPVEMLALQGE